MCEMNWEPGIEQSRVSDQLRGAIERELVAEATESDRRADLDGSLMFTDVASEAPPLHTLTT
jgi:hypothetical protein